MTVRKNEEIDKRGKIVRQFEARGWVKERRCWNDFKNKIEGKNMKGWNDFREGAEEDEKLDSLKKKSRGGGTQKKENTF